jgi:uncharacterized protein YydD (DUF2326 family)
MKLTRLYTNDDKIFNPITFNSGLNIIIGEIHLGFDKDKDTHNLGKSTLCQLIDYCMLKERNSDFFLFRHEELFDDLCFYLTLEISPSNYLTIKRNVRTNSKISLLLHSDSNIDARETKEEDWTHASLAIERAKTLVDSYLKLDDLGRWKYRKVLSYLLRNQSDYNDVFKTSRFQGKDKDWKPFVVHILGFNEKCFEKHYEMETQRDSLTEKEQSLEASLSDRGDSASDLDAQIAIKQGEVNDLQKVLDDYKFEPGDKRAVNELISEVEQSIANLNNQRYELRFSIEKIEKSLKKEKLIFSTEEAQSLFNEAGIFFEGQLAKDFSQLIEFNRDITEERRDYLKKDLETSKKTLANIDAELEALDTRRSSLLQQIGSRSSLDKFKRATNEIISCKTELEVLKGKRQRVKELIQVKNELTETKADLMKCERKIEEEIDSTSGSNTDNTFTSIRKEFDHIVSSVTGQHGILSVSMNNSGHADFCAEVRNTNGAATNADAGNTYRKLLCMAFDMALIAGHLKSSFPSFVYHDDAFSGLDERKRENLLKIVRDYSDNGMQQILTVIDSDMPINSFADHEIILRLNDEGNMGRLFKMAEW